VTAKTAARSSAVSREGMRLFYLRVCCGTNVAGRRRCDWASERPVSMASSIAMRSTRLKWLLRLKEVFDRLAARSSSDVP
jgi:hypothetical protein